MSEQAKHAAHILSMERRNTVLQKGAGALEKRNRDADRQIQELQAAILLEQKRQAAFAPTGSSLKREGASSLALELKKYQKRQTEDLEKELSRLRRSLDETTRVVAAKQEEINLLRKQALVINEEFLRRSNELDRSKMQLAISLEQANQFVKAKAFVAEQVDEIRGEAAKERQAWLAERDVLVADIKRVVRLLASDASRRNLHRQRGAKGAPAADSSSASQGQPPNEEAAGEEAAGVGTGEEESASFDLSAYGITLPQDDGKLPLAALDLPGGTIRTATARGAGAAGDAEADLMNGTGQPFGDLSTEDETRIKRRVRYLTGVIAALEEQAPHQAAQLQLWDGAFAQLTAATGERQAERLVARFLREDESNYALFAGIGALNDEAAVLQDRVLALHAEAEAARSDSREAQEAATAEARARLGAAELQAHEAEGREQALVGEIATVTRYLARLYATTHCERAAEEWAAASRASLKSSPHRQLQRENAAAVAAEESKHADRSRGSPGERGGGGPPPPSAAASRPASALPAPSRRGEEGGQRRAGTEEGVPSRSLMDFAGLSGAQRGAGLKVLLAEGTLSTAVQPPPAGAAPEPDAEWAIAAAAASGRMTDLRAPSPSLGGFGDPGSRGGGLGSRGGVPGSPLVGSRGMGIRGAAAAVRQAQMQHASVTAVEDVTAATADASGGGSAMHKSASALELGGYSSALAPTPPPVSPVQSGRSSPGRGGGGESPAAVVDVGTPAIAPARPPSASVTKRLPAWMAKAGAAASGGTPGVGGVVPLWELAALQQQRGDSVADDGGSRSGSPNRAETARAMIDQSMRADGSDTQVLVPAGTIEAYVRILERRVQQLCAEYDRLLMAAAAMSPSAQRGGDRAVSRFGVRGPPVARDEAARGFHIEPPDLDDGDAHESAAEAADAALLATLRATHDTLKRSRRASLASLVDGVATAPPGLASAFISLEGARAAPPVVEARPGTTYAGGAASAVLLAEAAARLARGEDRRRRASSAAAAAADGEDDDDGLSVAAAGALAGRRGSSAGSETRASPVSASQSASSAAAAAAAAAYAAEAAAARAHGFVPATAPGGSRATTSPASRGGQRRAAAGDSGGGGSSVEHRELYLVERHVGSAQFVAPPTPSASGGRRTGAVATPGGSDSKRGGGSSAGGMSMSLSQQQQPLRAGSPASRRRITAGMLPATFSPPNARGHVSAHAAVASQSDASTDAADPAAAGVRAAYADWAKWHTVTSARAAAAASTTAAAGGEGGAVVLTAPSVRPAAAEGDDDSLPFSLHPESNPRLHRTLSAEALASARSQSSALGRGVSAAGAGQPRVRSPAQRLGLQRTGTAASSASSLRLGTPGPPASASARQLPRVPLPMQQTQSQQLMAAGTARSTFAAAATADLRESSSSMLPRLAAGIATLTGTAAGSRRPKYPKLLYSGYALTGISNYEGAGSGFAYASTTSGSAVAARQRLTLAVAAAASSGTHAAAGGAAAPLPVDSATLAREVRRQYGEALPQSEEDMLLGRAPTAPGAAAPSRSQSPGARRPSQISQFVREGAFDDEEFAARQARKDVDRRRQARRRSFEQLEATWASAKKAAHRISQAEQHKDAARAVRSGGSDIEASASLADAAQRPVPVILGAIAQTQMQRRAPAAAAGSAATGTGGGSSGDSAAAAGPSVLTPLAEAAAPQSTYGPLEVASADGLDVGRSVAPQAPQSSSDSSAPGSVAESAAEVDSEADVRRATVAAALASSGSHGVSMAADAPSLGDVAASEAATSPRADAAASPSGTRWASEGQIPSPVALPASLEQAPSAAGLLRPSSAARKTSVTLQAPPAGFVYARTPSGQIVLVPAEALAAASQQAAQRTAAANANL